MHNFSRIAFLAAATVLTFVALVWIIRNSTNEPDLPDEQPAWRRFVPRIPKRPWNTGSGERSKTKSATARRR